MIQANSIAVVFGTIFVCILPPASCAESAHEIYARRVLPLLEFKDKSSCTECHLRGVELKDFLSTDPAKTFSELRGRGWIDTREPEKSKLLAFISRAPEAGDPLLEKVRTAESSALREWIIAAVADPLLLEQSLPKIQTWICHLSLSDMRVKIAFLPALPTPFGHNSVDA